MNVKELIQELKKLPQDLPIRTDNEYPDGENEWIVGLEHSELGESGYELEGEVRLLTDLNKYKLKAIRVPDFDHKNDKRPYAVCLEKHYKNGESEQGEDWRYFETEKRAEEFCLKFN